MDSHLDDGGDADFGTAIVDDVGSMDERYDRRHDAC